MITKTEHLNVGSDAVNNLGDFIPEGPGNVTLRPQGAVLANRLHCGTGTCIRRYTCCVVIDVEYDGVPLAFEVACRMQLAAIELHQGFPPFSTV